MEAGKSICRAISLGKTAMVPVSLLSSRTQEGCCFLSLRPSEVGAALGPLEERLCWSRSRRPGVSRQDTRVSFLRLVCAGQAGLGLSDKAKPSGGSWDEPARSCR